jgi:plastocyanin domain-containing protein
MITRVAVALALVFAVGCKKVEKSADKPKAAATATTKTGTVGTDGVRTIEVAANENGYVPDRIQGKPGEKLKLKFTRTIDGECLSQLKTPDGKLVELPKNSPIEVDVTVPADGEVKFACGMDMFFAVVVAEKA